jgi:peptidoglycan/LPS O-acetylase OafA/YrhL
VLLLVALFLPWYTRDTDIAGAVISQTWTAWQALPVITAFLFLLAVAAIAVPATPKPFRGDRLLVLLGAIGFLLVMFRAIDMPLPDIDLVKGDHADASRGPGLFLGLLATAGIAYGGRRDSRTGPR